MSRSFKKNAYTGSKRFDKSCRCHGGCPHCEGNRLLYTKIGEELLKIGLKEVSAFTGNRRGRLRVVRLNTEDIKPLEQITRACPKQVFVDLTEAKRKIKLKLKQCCDGPTW